MNFNKLDKKSDGLYVTHKVPFISLINLDPYFEQCFEFAFGMSFGKTGHHRAHRTGGRNDRKNGELFINAFQGKLSEFGVWDLINRNQIYFDSPDIDQWGKGIWDNGDFVVNGSHLSVKSTSNIGNLLLLEVEDWNENAEYIPNIGLENSTIDYHILTRVNPDGKKIMTSKRWLFLNEIDMSMLFQELKTIQWSMDVPGYITQSDLQILIKNDFQIRQNEKLNGRIPMDASNYYCQAGDLRNIEELIKLLK